MIHTRIQLDPNAQVSVRHGEEAGTYELVAQDTYGEASLVVDLTAEQAASLGIIR